jgi:hypothetical protein
VKCAVLWITFILLPGAVFAAARDVSRFHGAELLKDGQTVLFSYTAAKNVLKSSSLLGFGGGRASYRKDTKYIGLYHLENKKTEILLRLRKETGTRGQGNFLIRGSGSRGRKAMVVREPRQRNEESLPVERYILDVDQKAMTRIHIEEEMTELGMEEWRTIWLASGDGSLVVLAYSPGQKSGQANSVPLGHVWLRSGSGQYRLLTKMGSYNGTVEKAVLIYDNISRKSLSYNLATGENRIISNREMADLKLYNTNYGKAIPDMSVRPDRDGKSLQLGRKIDGAWQYSLFSIDMSSLR